MNHPLKTKQLEFDKSSFLLDLIKHDNGKLYIEVSQHILEDKKVKQILKINPTIIPELIKVLEDFYAEIPGSKPLKETTHDFISEAVKSKIQVAYLKGVAIKDLAIQFDIDIQNIEMILRNKKIVVLSENEEKKMKKGSIR